jgi:simple sugar transport system substrate-binding protein
MNRLTQLIAVVGLIVGFGFAAHASADKPRIVIVTHGEAASTFWSVVKNGVVQAQKDLPGIAIEYHSPEVFDMVAMKQLIDAAVASKPDGLAVSIPDASALGPSIQAAVAAGIPVVTLNSGSDVSRKLGALIHVGQSEFEAGVGAGARMKVLGVKNPVCVSNEVGNVALDQRCEGFAKGMGMDKVPVVATTPDPTEARNSIGAYLTSHPDIDGMITLTQDVSGPTLQAVDQADKLAKIKIATFDSSTPVLTNVRDGKFVFAIDQQQFLQGYLPPVLLLNYIRYGVMPGADVLTGPGFITKDNAAKVMDWAKAGYR